MKSRLEKVYSKLPNQKVNLKAHKVDLSLVDDIDNEYQGFRDAYDEASNLAYGYGDEIISAYEDFKRKYDLDNYIVNGKTRYLEEIGERVQGFLGNLENKADELGIKPSDIIEGYDEIVFMVDNYKNLNKDAEDKYREVTEYTGMPNLWN